MLTLRAAGMNGEQIQTLLSLDHPTKNILHGFGTPDLPLNPPKHSPSLYVLNTDNSQGPGEHWCAVYFGGDGECCEFFDSFGFSPVLYKFDVELFKHSKKVLFNNTQLQDLTSKTCGYYVVFFAMHRCRGLSMRAIINKFSKTDFHSNDKIVEKFACQFGAGYKI